MLLTKQEAIEKNGKKSLPAYAIETAENILQERINWLISGNYYSFLIMKKGFLDAMNAKIKATSSTVYDDEDLWQHCLNALKEKGYTYKLYPESPRGWRRFFESMICRNGILIINPNKEEPTA